jgi:dipeptidyl aminopeptidase/acylaminoacyl peptidase
MKVRTTMKSRRTNFATAFALAAFLLAIRSEAADVKYQKPPKAVLDVFNAPQFPVAFPNPSGDTLLLATPVPYPPISDLAKPMLRLAGLRIDPTTNGEHHPLYWSGLLLKKVADGSETKVELPANARPGYPVWSADGKFFAFANVTPKGIELWIATATGQARRLEGVRINGVFGPRGNSIQWMPDLKTLLVRLVPPSRGPAPAAPEAPEGPNVQESSGGLKPSSTYEVRDVLKSPHDQDLFDYYALSQVALVDVTTGAISPLGKPAVYGLLGRSPDGQYILVERIHRPYSYLHTFERFPKEVEIWNRTGEMVHKLASLPLADQVPIHGEPTGARLYSWLPTEPATLIWAEALDGGDPRKKVPHRDQVRTLKVPFSSKPTDLFRTEQRFLSAQGIEKSALALVTDFDIDRHWRRTFLAEMKQPMEPALQLLWEVSSDDKYKDPGAPVLRILPSGSYAVRQDDDWIYLHGVGGSPDGERPFLDRFNLRARKSERLFRSDKSSYERFVAWVDPARGEFVTRRESLLQPPNYVLRTLTQKTPQAVEMGEASLVSNLRSITKFPDPAPQLRQIKKQLVKYKRPDGVDLSFTLYLPPAYKPGTRLPTMFYAYPLDYTEARVAGHVHGTTQQFTMFYGSSHLFFLLAGYAVLDMVAMPIVGPSLTAYDTYLEQLVADAKAAVEKAVDMGVADPERIGVMGHSHGAMMTANLLAHSDLFRAGIARSGAYNKSLTAFGFQNERRSLWEARDTYIKVSPLFFADKIKQPLLLIHGEADFNPGTIPSQSERLYEAVRGTGGTTRLVMLPFESHGYQARESVEHTLYEMLAWFDRYVKDASPRGQKASRMPAQ